MRPSAFAGAAALAVAVATAGACSEPVDRVAEAERTIGSLLAERLELEPVDVVVACPDDDDLLPGSQLTCAVAVEGAEAVDVVFSLGATEGDPARLARAVIPTTDAETYLETELATPAEGQVEADCGDEPILVRDVGETFPCQVLRVADQVPFQVTVTVFSLDGAVRHRVEPTTTTTTAAPPP